MIDTFGDVKKVKNSISELSSLKSEDSVEGGRGLHGLSELGQVHVEVATDVNFGALASIELSNNLSLVVA